MPAIDDQGRPEPDPASDEVGTLLGFLEFQRATLEWKTRGLDETGLRARFPTTSMTLAGLLNHMAWVEDHWFSHVLLGAGRDGIWSTASPGDDHDREWIEALGLGAGELRRRWTDACEVSRRNVRSVLAEADLGHVAARPSVDGAAPTLRWIIVHMIEEYARHNGHADLMREAVDGQTGE